MNNTFLVIITALVSGLCATLVTLIWQHRTRIYTNKMNIFRTLMAYRYMISDERCVAALNSIDVVFYGNKDVRNLYKEFWNEINKPTDSNPVVQDKFLRLLEEMANVLRFKDIHWDDIKRFYYPIGLSEKVESEIILRKLQLENAQGHTNYNQQNLSPDVQIAVFNMLAELSKNPESMKAVLNFAKQFRSNK